jgi:dTDP-4-amino-4,6-dideoxygalactose transaminase
LRRDFNEKRGVQAVMKIPAFQIYFDQDFRENFHQLCEQILDEGFLTDHTIVRQFEQEFAEFSGAEHAVALSTGTAAIEAALLAMGVAGKEVILPTNTFIATAAAIEGAGGIPVPVDIENSTFGLDPGALARRLSPNTGAVIVVHAGGLLSSSLPEIAELCKSRGVPLVEDCAHAHGCRLDGRPAGTFGVAGCFSFFPTKVMTAGEGGMVTTNDSNLAAAIRSVKRFGREESNPISHSRRGSNFKMTEFQAALGLLDVRRSAERIRRRTALAQRYQQKLGGTSWKPIIPAHNAVCSHYKQIVLSPVPRHEVEKSLLQEGVALTGGVYYIPLHRQPVYRASLGRESFPVADWFAESHICPPCYPELSDSAVDHVCELLLRIRK